MVTAVVLVRTERERVQEAAQAMLKVEGVTEVYSVTGPYDLVVMVRIPDFERLAEIVPENLAQIPGYVVCLGARRCGSEAQRTP